MAAANARGAILVTGASSGIGAAVTESLAHAGVTAFACVRSAADAERVGAKNPHVRPLLLDVTDAASIQAAADAVHASGLVLDAVVNNAGIALGGPLEFLPLGALRKVFEVNVFGAVAVTQAFLADLRSSRGRLVFVGSVSGRIAMPFLAPYSVSKFALRAVADALRVELAPWDISVSLIEASSADTPIWRKADESRAALLHLLGPQANEYYKEELDALFRMTNREGRTAMPVKRVSDAVLHALLDPRPRAYYPVGSAMAGLLGLLPAAWQDRIKRRLLGLTSKARP